MSSQYCVLKQSGAEAPQGKKKGNLSTERSKSLIGDTYAIVSQPEPTSNKPTIKDSKGYEHITAGGINEPLPIDNGYHNI